MNGLDPNEATETLKNLLKVGQPPLPVASGEASCSDQMPPTGVTLLQQLFATAANAGSLNAMEQLIELRGMAEGEAIPFGQKDVRIDVRVDKAEYLNNKVKIRNIVDLGWENKFTYGNQIAEHCSRDYVAYTLKMASGVGGVRVINIKTNCRALIKGIQGQVADLAFAHIKSEVILAVVDDLGNLYVYQIGDDGGISYFPLFQVNRHLATTGEPNRVIWCKYIPDDFEYVPQENDQENFSKLLMVSHKNRCEFYYIDMIISRHGQSFKLDEGDFKVGCDVVAGNIPGAITEGSIAPEATTAAVATSTGLTKFIKLNMTQDPDKRQLQSIHEWMPHQGPISSVFFLDDHQYIDPDARFWEYVVTGADENRELKLWDCASWTCRQTIRFDGFGREVCLKARMDLSSNYIILSDLSNNVLYIIQIRKEVKNGTTVSASFASIAYFHLTFPVVSFAVSSVSRCKYKPMEEHVLNILERDDDDESKKLEGILVELTWLTTKSLQQCKIIYRPLKDPEPALDLTTTATKLNSAVLLDSVVPKMIPNVRSESDASSPSKEVADILQQTESEENGNTSPEGGVEGKNSPSDLVKACEKLQEQAQQAVQFEPLPPSEKELTAHGFGTISINVEDITRELGDQLTRSLTNDVEASLVPALQTSIGKIGEDCKLAFLTEARQTTRDAVNQVICPTFERISQKLFHDIASNLNVGFKQMLDKVEGHFEARGKERHDLNKKQLESALDSAISQMVKHMNKTMEQSIQQCIAQCRETVTTQVATEMAKQEKVLRTVVREEVGKALQAERRSLMASPAGSLSSMDSNRNAGVLHEIKLLLSQGEVKKAFSRALSVSDLDVLIQTLRMADRKSIFKRDRCPLTPQVLVALIQQLSADISTHTQLKLDYLEDAMMTLDAREEVTKQLLLRILPSFVESLKNFLRSYPQHADHRRVERLRSMAELYTDRVSSGY
ncbi:enhancer of mRNA-decapping protein 4-like [Varroa jacobsoni]|uniref:enhancer of mRNA-decapping protein 4-like n=1 Tax=Varroa jacobsoni TaxID=62625 RepID=UPI000BF54666|nr:enhancer of mRNA-decapping protein 4-like [Varroa jacobsoni]XP_022685834.1 enhancer of mRNA-decapping protein 4-like [Varroa jacobsoni]XP_022685836.1 enhancer of mRNA-decapping protein 4-like [Varroa jacobsoni]